MEPHDKVVLFGSYAGFGWSTLAENSVFVMLDNGDRVEVPEYLVKDASEFVEKDKMKLKDVIARIEKLDIGTQKVWLDEILNKLGSDYGTLKYKAGYEQGKFEGSLIPYDGPQKVKVSEEEAKFLETFDFKCEIDVTTALYHVLRTGWGYYLRDNNGIELKGLTEGFENLGNRKRLIKAILDGYEVAKEKRYIVKVKGAEEGYNYLNCRISLNEYFFSGESEPLDFRVKHTREMLEKAGFGWVFDCEGIEVKEVKE